MKDYILIISLCLIAQNASQADAPNFIAPIYAYYAEIQGKLPKKDISVMPVFILAATDDELKLNSYSLDIYKNAIDAGQQAELHLVVNGGHGFGMRIQNKASDNWIETYLGWLKRMNLLELSK